MALFEDLSIKNKIKKLKSAREDLVDDNSSINKINSSINDVITEVQSFICVGAYPITSKLENYKEKNQYNDSDIINAREYLQYEINSLQRKLDD